MMLDKAGKKKVYSKHRLLGTSIAELPLALWIIFIGIGMPLLSLVLTTVRYALFMEAGKQAADAACSAQTYNTGSGSAVNVAQDTAVTIASTFPGITVSPDNINCWIVSTPISGSGASSAVGPNSPLTSPPDPANLYQIRVEVTGQLDPVLNVPYFVDIPGLSAPYIAKVSFTRVFENPPGLYQSATSSSTSSSSSSTSSSSSSTSSSSSSTSSNSSSTSSNSANANGTYP